MMHGFGVFEWADKRKYVGNYAQEKKEGQGTFYWPDGKVYKGEWKDGVQHGVGYLTEADGKSTKKGQWKQGNFERWLD